MNVVFEEQGAWTPTISRPRGATGWLIEHGIARTSSQAQTMLLALVVACVIASFLVARDALTKEPLDPGRHFVPAFPSR